MAWYDNPNLTLSRRQFSYLAGGLAVAATMPALVGCDSAEKPAAAASPSLKPRQGGTLRVGITSGSSADSLDAGSSATLADLARATQLYDTILENDHNMKIQLGLAEEVEPSPDARSWTIRLKDGVEFHDGKTLSAEDVRFTLGRILNPDKPLGPAPRLSSLLMDEIKILDKRTIRLPFSKPYAHFREALAEGGSSGLRIIHEGYDPAKPVGTGPFRYKSFTPGDRSVFERHPNHFRNGQPYVDELVMINLSEDSTRVNALLGGDVEAIMFVPESQINIVKANSGLAVLDSPSGGWNPITMRMDIAPFNDKRVRQAFRLMVDRKQMIAQAKGGLGDVANDMFARFDPAYNSSLPQREQDIEQARALLKAAGQEGLVVDYVAKDQFAQPQVFAEQARAAGVTINVKKVDSATYWAQHFLKTPLSQLSWATRSYLLTIADTMLPTAIYNATHWEHPGWLKLVTEAAATVDDAKRSELIQAAQQIEYDEGAEIIWAWNRTIDGYSKKVHGFVEDTSGINLAGQRLREVWLEA